MTTAAGRTRLADQPQDFSRFGIDPGAVQPFEDAARASIMPGEFEWWYADAILSDRTYCVVVFFSKPLDEIGGPAQPHVFVSIARPGQPVVRLEQAFAPTEFRAGTGNCDVRIGPNTFQGDLDRYDIHVAVQNVTLHMQMKSLGQPLRRGTGHLLFTDAGGQERYFAWLPAVPSAVVDVTYAIDGQQTPGRGVGYHDHNWGNADPAALMSGWYWARAFDAATGLTVILAQITPRSRYGADDHLVAVVLQGEYVLLDSRAGTVSTLSAESAETCTGKRFASNWRLQASSDDDVWTFDVRHDRTLLAKWLDGTGECSAANQPADPAAAPAYLRFAGPLTVEHRRAGELIHSVNMGALWERMDFGIESHQRTPGQMPAGLIGPAAYAAARSA